MDHQEAIGIKAAERYVAHELPPAEQEAFEEHFFDCQACADEVRFQLAFAANTRAALREQREMPAATAPPLPLPAPQKWRILSPALALSLAGNLVLAAGLAGVLAGRGHVAHAQLTAIYFAPGPVHGADDVHPVAAGQAGYGVRFLVPSPRPSAYFFEVLDSASKRELSGPLPVPASHGDDLSLQIPVEQLPNGIHTLEIHADGPDGAMVSRSRFQTSR